jgi:hypothetical protein
MSNEITLRRAQLADKKRSLEEKNLRAKSHVLELRSVLDPYEDDSTRLRMNVGRAEWQSLSGLWEEMCDLKKQIDHMERDLNG